MPILGSQSSGTKGAPSAPTVGTATVTNSTTVSLTFTPPDSKLPITSYTATSSPSIALTTSGTTSPITITGTFVQGTAYTFTLSATNANGTSTASSASDSITPDPQPKVGYNAGGGITNVIDRLNMLTDTKSTLSATLSTNKWSIGSFANSGTAGYVGGGGSPSAAIEKVPFATETCSTIGATLPTARRNLGGYANSGTAGYFAGGYDGSYLNSLIKLTFSNDSSSDLGAKIGASRYNCGHGMANSGTAGYISGGEPTGGQENTSINRFVFSTEVSTNIGNFQEGKQVTSAFANSGTAGYFVGGSSGSNKVYKVPFSNDSVSLLETALPVASLNASGFANSGTAGYHAGGENGVSNVNTIRKFPFSTETSSNIAATITAAVSASGGFANSGTL